MASTLVETKLFIPRPRESTVPRPRLGERLVHNRDLRLTLLSAPAGFGKTTLLADWLHEQATGPDGATQNTRAGTGHDRERVTAWVSLEEDDRDPVRFWTYVATAVQRATGRHEGNALAVLTSRRPSVEGSWPPSSTNWWLSRRTLSWCWTTTTSSTAPWSSLVSRSSSTTYRRTSIWSSAPAPTRLCHWPVYEPAANWPRSAQRTSGSPNTRRPPTSTTSLDLNLSKGDVAALGQRTEGWAAALQLAALSLQGHRRPERFHRQLHRRRPLHRRLPGRGGA